MRRTEMFSVVPIVSDRVMSYTSNNFKRPQAHIPVFFASEIQVEIRA